MSQEERDLEAGLQEFMAVFRYEDKKIRPELLKLFITGFKRSYNEVKGEILSHIHIRAGVIDVIRRNTSRSIDLANHLKTDSARERANNLGIILGTFLSTIENGIPYPYFGQVVSGSEGFIDILQRTGTLATALKDRDIPIKPKFIGNRIKVIARKTAGQMSNSQQELISRIAAQFM